jgi:hypothetical protein
VRPLKYYRALGDLQTQAGSLQPGLFQRPGDVPNEIGVLYLLGGEVDAYVEGWFAGIPFLPGAGLAAGLFQHPPTDGDDQAALLRDRDKLPGAEVTVPIVPLEVGVRTGKLRIGDPEDNALSSD